MISNICIFASSCNYLEESYYVEAQRLGKLLAVNKYNLVYGGSCLGLMWACAKEIKEKGQNLIGVMPEKLHKMDTFSDYCDEFHVVPCMRTRKAKMDELSDAVVAIAGGFGTLEELSEMIVQKQLGYNNKPIIILNTNGFYNNLLEFFDEIIAQKFAHKNARNLYFVANTPEEVIEYLKNYDTNTLAMSESDIYNR